MSFRLSVNYCIIIYYSFNLSKNKSLKKKRLVELIGIEPITSALQGRRSPN